MFTGLVETIGAIVKKQDIEAGLGFLIQADATFLADLQIGESICMQGVCLTVTQCTVNSFAVDVSFASLQCTTLNQWEAGSRVNLERALLPTTRLGGHLVSGHVDSVAEVTEIEQEGDNIVLHCRVPSSLIKFIAAKGSICVDGVSLTINAVRQDEFSVNLIPHTWKNTTLGNLKQGMPVNIEIDMLARYVARFIEQQNITQS